MSANSEESGYEFYAINEAHRDCISLAERPLGTVPLIESEAKLVNLMAQLGVRKGEVGCRRRSG